MKKKMWLLGLLLLCLALLLSGCGKPQPAGQDTQTDLTCAQWADKIQAAAAFAKMTDVNQKYLEKNPGGYCHIPNAYFHMKKRQDG